mmetsp:Transcript_27228/g.69180  ORF Transcript_27228/g.69180 Transcript_27228/m.69180 type:complete len:201 (-) Transcript_27228:270-872(-)
MKSWTSTSLLIVFALCSSDVLDSCDDRRDSAPESATLSSHLSERGSLTDWRSFAWVKTRGSRTSARVVPRWRDRGVDISVCGSTARPVASTGWITRCGVHGVPSVSAWALRHESTSRACKIGGLASCTGTRTGGRAARRVVIRSGSLERSCISVRAICAAIPALTTSASTMHRVAWASDITTITHARSVAGSINSTALAN